MANKRHVADAAFFEVGWCSGSLFVHHVSQVGWCAGREDGGGSDNQTLFGAPQANVVAWEGPLL